MWVWLAFAVLLGLGWVRVFSGYPVDRRPRRPARVLSRRELATLDAVSLTLFPAGGAVPPSGTEAGVATYVDRLVAVSMPRQRMLMRALFFLVEHGTLLFPAPGGLSGMRRFSALTPEQREAVIASWQRSRLFPRRLVFITLRALCTIAYFSDPEVLRSLRLAPFAIETPVCEADTLYPRIGESVSQVRYGPADLTVERDLRPLEIGGPRLRGDAGVDAVGDRA